MNMSATRSTMPNISKPDKGSYVMVEVRPFSDGGMLVIFDGKSRNCYLSPTPPVGWKLVIDNKQHMLENPRDPTKIFTPSNGKIVKYLVPNGSHVKAGTAFVECEIMKMILPLVCDVDGIMWFPHAEGMVLETGELIARVEPDDLSSIRRAQPFTGTFPEMSEPRAPESKPYLRLSETQRALDHVMQGYFCANIDLLVVTYLNALADPLVPLSWFSQILSEYKATLPVPVKSALDEVLKSYSQRIERGELVAFPSAEMQAIVEAHAKSMSPGEGVSWLNNLSGFSATLKEIGALNPNQPEEHEICRLLNAYLQTEAQFQGRPQEVIMLELRDLHKTNLDHVFGLSLSYYSDDDKVEFLSSLLSEMGRRYRVSASLQGLLHQVYVLPKPRHVHLSLVAGRILNRAGKPSPDVSRDQLEADIAALVEDSPEEELLASSLEVLTRTLFPLQALGAAYDHVAERPRVAGAILRQYVSLLIAMLPFAKAKAFTSAESTPRLSFQWETAPVDVGDQGLPPSAPNSSSSSSSSIPRSPSMILNDTDHSLDVPASALRSSTGPSASRNSLACVFSNLTAATDSLANVLANYQAPNDATTRNILVIVLLDGSDLAPFLERSEVPLSDSTLSKAATVSGDQLQKLLVQPHGAALLERRIVRVTVVVGRFPAAPFFHSFRLRHGFAEDMLYRNFVPELGFLLELRRLDRYELELCPSDSSRVLVYEGLERLPAGSKRAASTREKRLFVRSFVNFDLSAPRQTSAAAAGGEMDWSRSAFQEYITSHASSMETLFSNVGVQEREKILRMLQEIEVVFVEAMNALEETIMVRRRETPSAINSLFFAIMTRLNVNRKLVSAALSLFMTSFGERLGALNVQLLELVLNAPASEGGKLESHRFVVTNESGVLPRVHSGKETRSLPLGVPSPRASLSSSQSADPDILSSEIPYVPNANVSTRRRHCRLLGTTYVWDYKDVLERALYRVWNDHQRKRGGARREEVGLQMVEYMLDDKDVMYASHSPSVAGSNTIGMLAWKVTIDTPEYPKGGGRQFVLIANDVSFSGGSFGPREDALFHQASRMARVEGIPRIYVSANAGARIGLADEVMACFKVAWKDSEDPSQGFDYLYIDKSDAEKMSVSVKTRPVAGDDSRLEITDIVGAKHGIGVENLQASGLIAGETSLAYRETFTLTIVTGRSVGIGAYVTRLGQRVIQNQGPILLTGYDALNRLLGREVYISNTQMGGPAIMYKNGVSHVDVHSDLDAFTAMLNWMAFVPRSQKEALALPTHSIVDPLSRPVEWCPQPSVLYDPRLLLTGQHGTDGEWQGGFFDEGSFMETLGGWARTVVTGRARLGGIPCGVIAVETRTVQKVVPADPASEESREQVTQQAGQVWYPDSAFKTAQAIADFNNGESLPLFIFANWRGFSGGVGDMFNEVLKFGSMIVDALSEFRQPVFVYLPPLAELRGGSWAVIDPFVNPHGMMEMYTSESAQGGILEAAGTVSIKFRKRQQLEAMVRLDPRLQKIAADRIAIEAQLLVKGVDAIELHSQLRAMAAEEKTRKEHLSRVYHSIAIRFCELHDTPGRMLEKKVVSGIVPWKESRAFFGKRLVERLKEMQDKAAAKAASSVNLDAVAQALSNDANMADAFVNALSPSARAALLERLK